MLSFLRSLTALNSQRGTSRGRLVLERRVLPRDVHANEDAGGGAALDQKQHARTAGLAGDINRGNHLRWTGYRLIVDRDDEVAALQALLGCVGVGVNAGYDHALGTWRKVSRAAKIGGQRRQRQAKCTLRRSRRVRRVALRTAATAEP